LVSGLIATGIVALGALLFRTAGPERVRDWLEERRRLGWVALAIVFLSAALISSIMQGLSLPRIVVMAVVFSLVLLLLAARAFVPGKFLGVERRLWDHPWEILAGLFMITTVAQLLLPTQSGSSAREDIVFVIDLADEELIGFRQVVTELEPRLDANVFLLNVSADRYISRLDQMASENKMRWDLIAADNDMLGVLAGKCLVEELTPHIERSKIMPSQLLSPLRALYSPKGSGQVYFAPFRPNVKVAFYNQNKFKQYGLMPPRTWEQLEEVARTFKQREGVGRVAIHGYAGRPAAVEVFEFVRAAGGNPVTLDDVGSRQAFEYLKRLEPYLAQEYRETRFDTANELMIGDEIYLVMNWTFGIKVIIEDAKRSDIQVYAGWHGPERQGHVLGGDVLAIPKGAPHAEKAARLIELLLSRDVQRTLFERLRWMPIRFDAYPGIEGSAHQGFDEAVIEALSQAELRPTNPRWHLVAKELDRAFGALIREPSATASLATYVEALRDIPAEFSGYRVGRGESLESVALAHGLAVETLAEANGVTPGTALREGQLLLVPGATPGDCS
jgi:trehalose transport system substrate-binding protein